MLHLTHLTKKQTLCYQWKCRKHLFKPNYRFLYSEATVERIEKKRDEILFLALDTEKEMINLRHKALSKGIDQETMNELESIASSIAPHLTGQLIITEGIPRYNDEGKTFIGDLKDLKDDFTDSVSKPFKESVSRATGDIEPIKVNFMDRAREFKEGATEDFQKFIGILKTDDSSLSKLKKIKVFIEDKFVKGETYESKLRGHDADTDIHSHERYTRATKGKHYSGQMKEKMGESVEGVKEKFQEGAKELKNDVMDASHKVKEKVKGSVEGVKEGTKEMKENVQGRVENIKEKMSEPVEEVKEKVQEGAKKVKENVQERFEDVKEKAQHVAKDIKDEYIGYKEIVRDNDEKFKREFEKEDHIKTAFEEVKDIIGSSAHAMKEKAEHGAKYLSEKIKENVQSSHHKDQSDEHPKEKEGTEYIKGKIVEGAHTAKDKVEKMVEDAKKTTTENIYQVKEDVKENVKGKVDQLKKEITGKNEEGIIKEFVEKDDKKKTNNE